MTDELLTIASSELAVAVNPLGAELWSIRDADGRNLMTDADPAFWTGHAPLLFPIVGTLANDTYHLRDGRRFALPRHGFARRRDFAAVEQTADRLVLRLEDDAETQAVYPFAFRLDMAFTVSGATLGITATVTNRDAAPLPFSLGFHPAFAWPLPYGAAKGAHRILFDRPEPAPIRRLDADGLLAPDPCPTPVDGRVLAVTEAMFEADAIIWDRLESRALEWGAPGHPGLRIAFPDMPCLGVWQKPGARYLCIEPWAGIADPAGFDGPLEDKPGIITLPPGEARSFRMDLTLFHS